MWKRKKKSGFTLLELLVVISIIAVLIGLASVSFATAQRKSRNSKRRGDMKAAQNAFEQYYAENNGYAANCTTMAAALPSGLPDDPKAPSQHYAFTCNTTTSYCVCSLLESELGNADHWTCTYSGAGTKSYYCLSNLQ